AGDAFVHGLHVTLVVSAGLLLLGAVMALRLPRAMQCEEVSVPAPRGAVDSPSRVSV
ncbi:MFS transporter, partial [Streptomyces rubrogriseus]|nr:MFS transporter [Streptomyces rubrogriseus]